MRSYEVPHVEGLKSTARKPNDESVVGGLPVDLAACAAARHLTQEGLKIEEDRKTAIIETQTAAVERQD
jgi:hypothetical protein